jgi:hypothetical protein
VYLSLQKPEYDSKTFLNPTDSMEAHLRRSSIRHLLNDARHESTHKLNTETSLIKRGSDLEVSANGSGHIKATISSLHQTPQKENYIPKHI